MKYRNIIHEAKLKKLAMNSYIVCDYVKCPNGQICRASNHLPFGGCEEMKMWIQGFFGE